MILPPLMHGAAQWACFMLMATGATLIFPDDDAPGRPRRRVERGRAREGQLDDHRRRRRAAARCSMQLDKAEVRPVVVLRRRERRGAADAGRAGHGGLTRIPNLVISDSAGSSETGAQMSRDVHGRRRRRDRSCRGRARWSSTRRCRACSRRGTRATGGWPSRAMCRSATWVTRRRRRAPSRSIDGVRYSIPGDRARHRPTGRSSCSVATRSRSTRAARRSSSRRSSGRSPATPPSSDVVVVGRPSERWGQEVVAVVQLAEGASTTADVRGRGRLGPHRPLQAAQGGGLRRPHPALAVGQGRLPLGRRDGVAAAAGGRDRGRSHDLPGSGSTGAWRTDGGDVAAGAATVQRHGPVSLLRVEHPPAGGRTARLVVQPGRERRHDRSLQRRDDPRGMGLLGRRGDRRRSVRRHGRAAQDGPPHADRTGIEIGWRLHPDHWCHGYATEAARPRSRTASIRPGCTRSSPSRPP